MTFDSIEKSVQDGTVAELYDFVAPVMSWRLTTARQNITFGGNPYVSTPGVRSNIGLSAIGGDQNFVTVQIPATHALAQMYVAGTPPRDLLVTIYRYHVSWGVSAQFWKGYASSIQFSGQDRSQRTASFRVPSGLDDALGTDVPSVAAQRLCNHVLYDSRCTVNRAAFGITTTISSISADGLTIATVGAVPGATQGLPFTFTGELLHVASGERRTIVVENTTTNFKVQAPFPNGTLHVGDSVQVYAGCTKTIEQCQAKFSNGINHGGFPYMPTSNIFYVGLRNARYGI